MSESTPQPNQQQQYNEWNGSSTSRIYPVTEGIGSNQTKIVYERAFNHFLDYIKIHDLQVLLDFSPKVIKQMIVDYVIWLRDEKPGTKLSRSSIKVHLSAILHFFQINNDDFNLTIRHFRIHLPSDDTIQDDRPYSRDEIAQIIKDCDPRSKAVILLLCSTGMRIGALPKLQKGHLTEVDFQGLKLYRVQVYAGTRDKYYSFATPEAAKAVRDYLDYRERYHEQLTDRSPLIREQFNIDDEVRIKYPRFISMRAIEYLIDNALQRSGIRKPGEVHMTHGFRKFFITQCDKAGLNFSVREYLSGHRLPNQDPSYIRTTEEDRLAEYVKAIPLLTIDPNQRLQDKVEKLESEKLEGIEELKSQLIEYKKFAEKTAAEINDLKVSRGLESYEISKFFAEPNFSKIVIAINELRTKNGQEPVAIVTTQEAAQKAEENRLRARYIRETRECPPLGLTDNYK